MTYDPERDEVFYCGSCGRQQQPKEGERCKDCGKQTVSWYTNRESEADALRKWKHING
jgi:DNA-directed RNA polymerase subunit M/transcription elongation factor TFIIS